jgi:dTDP-4-dehydrorhamnose 3,5-epimerase
MTTARPEAAPIGPLAPYTLRSMHDAQVAPGFFDGAWILRLEHREDHERPGSSFREVWQADVLRRAGVPAFHPIQWNVAVSPHGTLRGIHAEPWHKMVHVIDGEVFAAIVDLRASSPTAGEVWTVTLDPSVAVLIGPGLGNSYQVTGSQAVYAYLVDGRWDGTVTYPAVRWDDPDLAIDWPITDERLAISTKDRSNPSLKDHWRSGSA